MRKKWVLIPLLLVFLVLMSINNVFAASETGEIDIATSPSKILFDVNNMKPGDWSIREYTILNKGKQDFEYTASADLKSGSKKLYKELNLQIQDKNGNVYDGKLANFKRIDYRKLAKADQETLKFRVDFPEELGNEFQGLACEVTIKLYVKGTLGGLLPADGGVLPNTASNVFNYIAGGVIFIIGGVSMYTIYRRKSMDVKRT